MHIIERITDTEYILNKKAYNEVCYGVIKTSFGDILLATVNNKICAAYFIDNNKSQLIRTLQREWKYSGLTEDQSAIDNFQGIIRNWFKNDFQTDLLLKGTPFQTTVWELLMKIPYGTTCSYQDLSDTIVNSSARAIGGAVSRNEISLLIPCHRVIHNNGEIGNHRWGRKLKAQMIRTEKGEYEEGLFPEY